MLKVGRWLSVLDDVAEEFSREIFARTKKGLA